ncbi:MAG TPA: OB-fold nucleic acid binding domain-containing protein, partial [Desulfobacteria bacterium]|nr:OB-fold nucleic acid binding domain-containing protein [Desulfobacteria bacterium]
QLMASLDSCVEAAQKRQKDRAQGQISLFDLGAGSEASDTGGFGLPNIPEYPRKELLVMEKEMLGLYISGHPLNEYEQTLREKTSHAAAQLGELADGTTVIIGGVISSLRRITTRKGDPMAFAMVEDLTGTVEVVIFPTVCSKAAHLIKADSPVLVRGRVNFRDDEVKVIALEMAAIDEKPCSSLYLKIPALNQEKYIREIKSILRRYRGNSPVFFYFESQKKLYGQERRLWVNLEKSIMDELTQLLGESGVHIKD